jgi:uncharacterized protein (TIGR03086 family)
MDTTTNSTSARPAASTASSLPAAGTDPRPLLARAVAVAEPVIAGVRPDQLGGPTPCDALDVRDLLGHLTGALRRVGVIGRGLDVQGHPAATPGVPDDGWPAVWSATAEEVEQVWSDPALLTRTYQLPWASLTGEAVVATYTSEVTLHTWDLAVATGQQVAWDDEVVARSLDAMREALPTASRAAQYAAVEATLPPEARPMAAPFADAVDVPGDASALDQLVAWSGRRPASS